ncbi:zinc-dependent alcohol dehydrogenase family protein [Yinghuangia seranimata]|uniref:zinc-dependent alcohol dehydrogenase family protein n=1 Tax=Yinghuangia seranimata TaxID=408067 RepID=UPI00248B62D0|nr:NAD(P)-dependent alcohol dehydrogenase [Yinghuangia seranimata]MDI2129168.1 NAD(P)-dependent alcohol dehydrogenase [Yinghuangia seranimata]
MPVSPVRESCALAAPVTAVPDTDRKAASTMRSYHLSPGAAPFGLARREHAVPEPGPGQALVRMRANAVGFRDTLVREADYPLPLAEGVVAGCEGVGEVVAVGAGVSGVAEGDRVALTVFPHWLDGPFAVAYAAQLGGSVDGALAEYAVVAESALVRLPGHLSYEEAVALPLGWLTAWNALTGGRRVLPGETVVALGTGGVSLAVVRLAALAGARVVVTSGDVAGKAGRLRALGAHHVLDRRGDWPAEVRELTGGRGAELVVDVAGSVAESLRAGALGGEVAYVGYRVGDAVTGPPVDARLLFDSGVGVRGVAVGSRAQLVSLMGAVEVHGLRPVVDRVFGFGEVDGALAWHASGRAFGRVVVSHEG